MSYAEIIEQLENADITNVRAMAFLNCDIHAAFTVIPKGYVRGSSSGRYLIAHGSNGRTWSDNVPDYCSSVDAAIALLEKALPGWRGSVQFGNFNDSVGAYVCADKDQMEESGSHSVPAMALCIAILKAKQDQQVAA